MSITDAVQVALIARLRGDAELATLIGDRVFDRVPVGAVFPYVSLGPEDWPQLPSDCIDGVSGVVQIDVWSRDVGRREAKRICDRIAALMREGELSLAAPYRCVGVEVEPRRIMIDPDGLTVHGVVPLSILAEDGG